MKQEVDRVDRVFRIIVIGIVVAAVAIVACIAGIKLKHQHEVTSSTLTEEDLRNDDFSGELNGYYVSRSTDPDSQFGDFYAVFADDGTFQIYMTNQLMASGSYTVNGNEIIASSENTSGEAIGDTIFFADDDVLMMKDAIYSGTVPDGETFNATFARFDSSENEYKYEFKDDGTYTLTCIYADEDKDPASTDGTYSRDGDYITRQQKDSDGGYTEMVPFYIYDGHLAVSVFDPIDAETFSADMEAMNNQDD